MIAPIRSEIQLRDVLASVCRNKGYGKKLEAALTEYFGVNKIQLTHSGRSALYFLLKALPQKKVYLPAFNCWAVAEAVMYARKEPEFIDISLDDFNMDITSLRDVLEPDSIIIATHQFGIPCDIDAIMKLAAEQNCIVLEDNAAAFGSEIRGKKTGSFAKAGILSFDYSKTLVSGKGGAILFNDEELYHKVREIYEQEVRPTGICKSIKYMLIALAYAYATHKLVYPLTYALVEKARGSYRSIKKCNLTHNEAYSLDFDDMRAKLAYNNMQRLDKIIDKRTAIIKSYMNDTRLSEYLSLPCMPENSSPVLIKLPIRPRQLDREALYSKCKDKGIDLEYLFPYHYLKDPKAHSNSEAATEQAIALPVYSTLTDRDLLKLKSVICDAANCDNSESQDTNVSDVEKRQFSFFTLFYYWLDTKAYLESDERIALLRTHEALPGNQYQLKFCYKTFLIDLGRTKDEIYADFDASGARYKIRKALKCGVVVKPAQSAEEKLKFYDFYQDFVLDPKRKNKILVLQKNEIDRLHIFYALSADGEFLGGVGLIPSPDGRILVYKYAATLHRFCENELLLWQGIQYAKDNDFSYFDMSQMTLTDDKNSDSYRLFQFKRKFGGELVDFYTYVRFKGPLVILAKPFELILKHFFDEDINKFALFLKKIRVFK